MDQTKSVGEMCQQLRWYIYTTYCFDFVSTFYYWLAFILISFFKFDFICSINSFHFILFELLLSIFTYLSFNFDIYLIWFYIGSDFFRIIIFIFTHSNFFRSRHNLDFIIWRCYLLLFRVDKIYSYSYFKRNM